MIGVCENCKHWKRASGHEAEHMFKEWASEDVGKCELSRFDEERKFFSPPLPDSFLMMAQDAEDYSAVLETRAEFGCVCWEAR